MMVDELGIRVAVEDGKDFEVLCKTFCHVLYQLKRIRDAKLRKANVDLAVLVMETLNRQFGDKAEKQYKI